MSEPIVTSKRVKEQLFELINLYPSLNIVQIGESRMGQPIYAVTIGNGARAVMYNAAHHANEWITTSILMRFIEECCNESNAKSKYFPDDVTLHVIPLVNPDGVDLVNGSVGRFRYAYKDAKKMCEAVCKKATIPLCGVNQTTQNTCRFPHCWKANICGVDLNSNYPADWEHGREHKYARGYTQPCARDYVGPNPLSEPETCAMVAYTKINDFEITISLHTQGEEIYWRYKNYKPDGAEELAQRLSNVSGYALQEVPSESSGGGYRDWFIQTFNRPGFTIECGLGENPLPFSQFEDIYKKTAPLLWEGLIKI